MTLFIADSSRLRFLTSVDVFCMSALVMASSVTDSSRLGFSVSVGVFYVAAFVMVSSVAGTSWLGFSIRRVPSACLQHKVTS